MKPRTLALLPLAALLVAACYGPDTSDLLGTWRGEDAQGNRLTFVFRDDSTVLWIVDVPAGTYDTFPIRYDVDLSEDPAHIGLRGIEGGPLAGMDMYGIIDLIGEDVLRMDLEPGPPGSDPDQVRPKDFGTHTVTFTRIAPSR